VVSAGSYAVEVDYSTAGDSYTGELIVKSAEQQLLQADLPAFKSDTLSTARQYYTDEAPDLTWKTLKLGVFTLEQGQQDLQVSFAKDKNGHELWLKQVRLIQQ
jgi:hypothetical protein